MRQSERGWRLHEVLVRVERFRQDLPSMLGALADMREAGEFVPVRGGDRSDPTCSMASTVVDFTANLDRKIKELHAKAEELERMRETIVGQPGLAPITDHEGRLIRDGEGKPIEYCELHHLVGSNEVARRTIPNPDGSGTKMRVCRWCGRYYDETGTAPTTDQVAQRASGKSYIRREQRAS